MSIAEGEVSTHSVGINTDELNKSELQRLVDNNKELQEGDVSNMDHEVKDLTLDINNSQNQQRNLKDNSMLNNSSAKQDLIEELNEKE